MTGNGSIRSALADEVSTLSEIAVAAYSIYVQRIGRAPAPMVADFYTHVARGEVFVLEDEHGLAAFIVTYSRDFDQFVENVAVLPDRQGRGYGKKLMQFAERQAIENKHDLLVLYTNLKMTENLAFYPRLGYVELRRVLEDGFERVYFEKRLSS